MVGSEISLDFSPPPSLYNWSTQVADSNTWDLFSVVQAIGLCLFFCLCSKVNIFILGSRHWACMYMQMYMIRLWFQILFVFTCYNSELLILWQCKVGHSWMLVVFCSRFLPACRRCLSSDLGDCLVPTRDYRPYVGLFPMIDGKQPSPHTLRLVQLDPRQVVK